MNRILAALVNGAMLGALLTAVVWLALRITPRRILNAATRYALWWATLAIVVALPAVYMPQREAARPKRFASKVGETVPSRIDRLESQKDRSLWSRLGTLPHSEPRPQGAELGALRGPQALGGASRDLPKFPIEIVASGWPRWVLLAWGAASVLLLLRLLASFILLGRTSYRAYDLPFRVSPGVTRRRVRLASTSEIGIPVAVGPWRPAILIPEGLLRELGEHELEQIVLHEASHLARLDDYALLLQRLVEALFSLHPVVRWIARRIDLEREVACDDRVIAVTGRPRSYATCLTRVVEWSCGVKSSLVAAAAADDGSHLARRVDLLLDKTRHTGTQLLKARLTGILAVVVALAWIAGRSPGFVAFAAPLVRAIEQAPARILTHAPLLARAAEEPQAGAAQFEARVLEDASGNPLASAEIRFHKAGMGELAADLDTDRNGRARAAGLTEGEYSLDVLKPNFITASLKVHLPAAGLTVRLVRYGAIGGQIMDQHGEAAPAMVHAPGGRSVGGTRIAVLVKEPVTGQLRVVRETGPDEDGRYRVFDLTPGQYAIGVWYDGLKDGSGSQLYPDSAHPRFFTVSGGEEYEHIDFQIRPQATFEVSGNVEAPKKGDQFALSLGLPDQPAVPIARLLTEKDGSFRFAKVPAGTYDLFAGGPSRGYGMHDDLLGPGPLFGRIRVDVGQNVEGLSIPLSPGRSFQVALGTKGASAPPSGCPKSAGVSAEPLDPWGLMFNAGSNTQVPFGGEAAIANLAPGRFRVVLTGLPAGCFQTNQPVVDLAGEVAAPVAVEVATAGSIRGTLRGAVRPAEFAVVLLDAGGAPDAGAQLAQADAQGRFAFDSLHPGRYRLAAQTGADAAKSRWVADVSKMIEIDVAAGSPTEIDLPVGVKGGGK